MLFLGLLFQSSGVLITGTDELSTWYNPGFFVIFGLIIFGFATAMVTIPVMPEILDAIEEANEGEDFNEESLHNNLSGYFVVAQGLGESLGPLTSSLLENRYEFRAT